MSVYIPCEHCQKRLKIPENVVGRSIKCPACNGVFKSDPAKVLPFEEAAPVVAIIEDEAEEQPKPRKKAAVLDDDEDAIIPAKKKAAVEDDEDEDEVRPPKKIVVVEDDEDDDVPARPKRRRAAEEDDEEDEEDERPRKGRRRTPWYVMLPLLLLSFTGVGLAWLWTIGFTWLNIDRQVNMQFDSRMWVGISLAVGVTLLCLICSLIPVRSWLRFLLVLAILALGYGGSFATVYWWTSLPFKGQEPPNPFPPQPAAPMGGGGRGMPGQGMPGQGIPSPPPPPNPKQ